MTYAPDPTYHHPHAGWTIQNPHSAGTADDPEDAPIEIIGPVEVTEDPKPARRGRKPRARRK